MWKIDCLLTVVANKFLVGEGRGAKVWSLGSPVKDNTKLK
jgi:hypothetical protein